MAEAYISDFEGINTYVNPFTSKDGNIIHCLNMESTPFGGKVKRSGYITFLGTADGSAVNSLFSWGKDDGTTLFLYRASGSKIYYSVQGTGAWTPCINGTITNGNHVGYSVLENQLVVATGDANGGSAVLYSSSGSSLDYASASPGGATDLIEYGQRMWSNGTASDIFYSTIGTPSDWTSDSSDVKIAGEGKVFKMFKVSDRLISCKNSGLIKAYDGASITDLANQYGPSSPYSVVGVEETRFWLNRYGIFMADGGIPKLVSNAIQHQIYNDSGLGIVGTVFDNAPGVSHKYDYLLSVGSVQDDLVSVPINNAIIKYDFQKNEFLNWQFAHKPTAWCSFRDTSGVQQLIWGDANGQCYKFSGTAVSDAGSASSSSMIIIIHAGSPHFEKEFKSIEFFTNPGCNAKVRFSMLNTVAYEPIDRQGPKVWRELCDLRNGYTSTTFPPESRGRICYLQFYEISNANRWALYSIDYTYDMIEK